MAQCVAVCFSVLQCVASKEMEWLQVLRVAARCNVLQCVATKNMERL